MGVTWGVTAGTTQHNMAIVEQAEDSTKLRFLLPSVEYSSSSLTLSSAGELQERKYPGPAWSYLVNESPSSCPQVLPSASNLTSLTYLGDRLSHPQLRMRIYHILQHRALH